MMIAMETVGMHQVASHIKELVNDLDIPILFFWLMIMSANNADFLSFKFHSNDKCPSIVGFGLSL